MMKLMRQAICLAVLFLSIGTLLLSAQSATPPGIPYHAIARNANGTPYVNAVLSVRFSFREQPATGTVSLAETQSL